MPPEANVAYAAASASGVVDEVPRTFAGYGSNAPVPELPPALTTPSSAAPFMMLQRSSCIAMVRYARLTEPLVASATVMTPRPPSAFPGVHFLLMPRLPHAVNWFSFSGRTVPSTRSLRLWPCLSHSSSVNGLNVDPGANPVEPP